VADDLPDEATNLGQFLATTVKKWTPADPAKALPTTSPVGAKRATMGFVQVGRKSTSNLALAGIMFASRASVVDCPERMVMLTTTLLADQHFSAPAKGGPEAKGDPEVSA
jgi:hypothetical protein